MSNLIDTRQINHMVVMEYYYKNVKWNYKDGEYSYSEDMRSLDNKPFKGNDMFNFINNYTKEINATSNNLDVISKNISDFIYSKLGDGIVIFFNFDNGILIVFEVIKELQFVLCFKNDMKKNIQKAYFLDDGINDSLCLFLNKGNKGFNYYSYPENNLLSVAVGDYKLSYNQYKMLNDLFYNLNVFMRLLIDMLNNENYNKNKMYLFACKICEYLFTMIDYESSIIINLSDDKTFILKINNDKTGKKYNFLCDDENFYRDDKILVTLYNFFNNLDMSKKRYNYTYTYLKKQNEEEPNSYVINCNFYFDLKNYSVDKLSLLDIMFDISHFHLNDALNEKMNSFYTASTYLLINQENSTSYLTLFTNNDNNYITIRHKVISFTYNKKKYTINRSIFDIVLRNIGMTYLNKNQYNYIYYEECLFISPIEKITIDNKNRLFNGIITQNTITTVKNLFIILNLLGDKSFIVRYGNFEIFRIICFNNCLYYRFMGLSFKNSLNYHDLNDCLEALSCIIGNTVFEDTDGNIHIIYKNITHINFNSKNENIITTLKILEKIINDSKIEDYRNLIKKYNREMCYDLFLYLLSIKDEKYRNLFHLLGFYFYNIYKKHKSSIEIYDFNYKFTNFADIYRFLSDRTLTVQNIDNESTRYDFFIEEFITVTNYPFKSPFKVSNNNNLSKITYTKQKLASRPTLESTPRSKEQSNNKSTSNIFIDGFNRLSATVGSLFRSKVTPSLPTPTALPQAQTPTAPIQVQSLTPTPREPSPRAQIPTAPIQVQSPTTPSSKVQSPLTVITKVPLPIQTQSPLPTTPSSKLSLTEEQQTATQVQIPQDSVTEEQKKIAETVKERLPQANKPISTALPTASTTVQTPLTLKTPVQKLELPNTNIVTAPLVQTIKKKYMYNLNTACISNIDSVITTLSKIKDDNAIRNLRIYFKKVFDTLLDNQYFILKIKETDLYGFYYTLLSDGNYNIFCFKIENNNSFIIFKDKNEFFDQIIKEDIFNKQYFKIDLNNGMVISVVDDDKFIINFLHKINFLIQHFIADNFIIKTSTYYYFPDEIVKKIKTNPSNNISSYIMGLNNNILINMNDKRLEYSNIILTSMKNKKWFIIYDIKKSIIIGFYKLTYISFIFCYVENGDNYSDYVKSTIQKLISEMENIPDFLINQINIDGIIILSNVDYDIINNRILKSALGLIKLYNNNDKSPSINKTSFLSDASAAPAPALVPAPAPAPTPTHAPAIKLITPNENYFSEIISELYFLFSFIRINNISDIAIQDIIQKINIFKSFKDNILFICINAEYYIFVRNDGIMVNNAIIEDNNELYHILTRISKIIYTGYFRLIPGEKITIITSLYSIKAKRVPSIEFLFRHQKTNFSDIHFEKIHGDDVFQTDKEIPDILVNHFNLWKYFQDNIKNYVEFTELLDFNMLNNYLTNVDDIKTREAIIVITSTFNITIYLKYNNEINSYIIQENYTKITAKPFIGINIFNKCNSLFTFNNLIIMYDTRSVDIVESLQHIQKYFNFGYKEVTDYFSDIIGILRNEIIKCEEKKRS